MSSISHIYLPVRDIDESIDFYTKKLGFKLVGHKLELYGVPVRRTRK